MTTEDGFFSWDGDYEKQFYYVRLRATGRVVVCWPNAGYMNEMDGKGRSFRPPEVEDIKPIKGFPWKDDGSLKEPLPVNRRKNNG